MNSPNPTLNTSVRSLWHLTLPMMLSAMTGSLMLFADRVILANYSLNALNAAMIASMVIAIPQYGTVGICAIAEVFVGQHNGAGRFNLLGQPVWQMLWFALALWLVFIPLALWGDRLFIPPDYREQGVLFYRWITLSAPLSGVIAALSAFFVGRGKPKVILTTTVIANTVNLILDFILVFGVKGYLPALGAQGAGIATSCALSIQSVLLFSAFIHKNHRHTYGAENFRFNPKVWLECLRIGGPNAIGHMIEIAAWALMLQMMAMVGELYVTVLSLGQTCCLLLAFVTDGLQKGMIAMASNVIGAQLWPKLKDVLNSGVKLHLSILSVLLIPMVIYPDPLLAIFIKRQTHSFDNATLLKDLRITLIFVWSYCVFDGLVWVIAGVLTAAKDTLFIMITNAAAAWCFAIVPTYLFIVRQHTPANSIWMMMNIYCVINFAFFAWRYTRKPWLK